MSDQRDALQNVSWQDCCPWMMIFRTFSLSIGVQALLTASVGVMLTLGVWRVSESVFINQDDAVTVNVSDEMPELRAALSDLKTKQPEKKISFGLSSPIKPLRYFLFSHPFATVAKQMVFPFVRLFDPSLKFTEFAHNLCGGLLTLLVWSVAGGAITRAAVVRLACDQRLGLKESIVFACRKLGAYFTAPIFPLLGVLFVALPIFVLGLFTQLPWGIGVFLAGPFWILVLLGGVLMAVMLLGLLFGWPLMWGTISAEGTDAFDALSRSYAYTFQRPLHYLFYGLLAGVLGLLGWILVHSFCEAVISLSYWAASRGNSSLIVPLQETDAQYLEYAGRWFISCWIGFVRIVPMGFSFSFFWCATAAIYLLLRRDTDQTETDEVYLDDEPDAYDLPSLETDAAGVPFVAEESSVPNEPVEETSGGPVISDEESPEDRPADMGG